MAPRNIVTSRESSPVLHSTHRSPRIRKAAHPVKRKLSAEKRSELTIDQVTKAMFDVSLLHKRSRNPFRPIAWPSVEDIRASEATRSVEEANVDLIKDNAPAETAQQATVPRHPAIQHPPTVPQDAPELDQIEELTEQTIDDDTSEAVVSSTRTIKEIDRQATVLQSTVFHHDIVDVDCDGDDDVLIFTYYDPTSPQLPAPDDPLAAEVLHSISSLPDLTDFVTLPGNRKLFQTLSQDCINLCVDVWSADDTEMKLRRGSGLDILSLHCLYPEQWLRGSIIDEMLNLICGDTTINAYKCTPVISDLFERIRDNTLRESEVRRLRKQYLGTHNLLIPCNEGGVHWTLIIVNVQRRIAIHCDSLSSRRSEKSRMGALHGVVVFFQRLYPEITGKWTHTLWETPQQDNTSDCGVHVIMNAMFFSMGAQMHSDVYPLAAVRYMRYRTVAQLVHGDVWKC